jgi:hypothetical protein
MEARSLAVCMTAIEARSLLVCMTVGGSHRCTLHNQMCNLESFGLSGRLHSVSHHKSIYKMRSTWPFCTLTQFLHITLHSFQKMMTYHCKNVITDIFCFTTHAIFLGPYILDENNKCSLVGQLAIHLWGKEYHSTLL